MTGPAPKAALLWPVLLTLMMLLSGKGRQASYLKQEEKKASIFIDLGVGILLCLDYRIDIPGNPSPYSLLKITAIDIETKEGKEDTKD